MWRRNAVAAVLEPGRPVLAPVDEGARLLAAEWALDDRDAARAAGLLAELPPGASRCFSSSTICNGRIRRRSSRCDPCSTPPWALP